MAQSWGADRGEQGGYTAADKYSRKALKAEVKDLKKALKHHVKSVWREAP